MPNYEKLRKKLQEEERHNAMRSSEARARAMSIKEERFRNFQRNVIDLLTEELCNELAVRFEVRTPSLFPDEYYFYAIIPVSDRKRIQIASNIGNTFWWVGVIHFHYEKDRDDKDRTVNESSSGYWYDSISLKEKVLLTYLRESSSRNVQL